MDKIVESREIHWCGSDDRYVLVVREMDEITGLNFMQGNGYPEFLRNYNTVDAELTKFYNSIESYLSGTTRIQRINQAIWAYLNYQHNY